jgi:hypothetical protein
MGGDESITLSAYRSAMRKYLLEANKVAEAQNGAVEAEQAQINALQPLLREKGLADSDNKPTQGVRPIIQFQAEEVKALLDELEFGPEHPVTQSVASLFVQLMLQAEAQEQHEAAMFGAADGKPLL